MVDATIRKLNFPPAFLPYLEKHRVFELFHEMAEELVMAQPRDHIAFLRGIVQYAEQKRTRPRIVFMSPPRFDQEAFAEAVVAATCVVPIYRSHLKSFFEVGGEEDEEDEEEEEEHEGIVPDAIRYEGDFEGMPYMYEGEDTNILPNDRLLQGMIKIETTSQTESESVLESNISPSLIQTTDRSDQPVTKGQTQPIDRSDKPVTKDQAQSTDRSDKSVTKGQTQWTDRSDKSVTKDGTQPTDRSNKTVTREETQSTGKGENPSVEETSSGTSRAMGHREMPHEPTNKSFSGQFVSSHPHDLSTIKPCPCRVNHNVGSFDRGEVVGKSRRSGAEDGKESGGTSDQGKVGVGVTGDKSDKISGGKGFSGNEGGGSSGDTTLSGANASGSKETSANVSGGKEATVNASGGKEASVNGSGGMKGTLNASGGKEATVNGSGGKEGTLNASGGKEASVNGSGGMKGTLNASGGKEATVNGSGGKEGTLNASGGKEATVNGSGGKEGTLNASGENTNESLKGHGKKIEGSQRGKMGSGENMEGSKQAGGRKTREDKCEALKEARQRYLEQLEEAMRKQRNLYVCKSTSVAHPVIHTFDDVSFEEVLKLLPQVLKLDWIRERGWILVDIPRNREEAREIARVGVLPTHAFHMVSSEPLEYRGVERSLSWHCSKDGDMAVWERLHRYRMELQRWKEHYSYIPVKEVIVGDRDYATLGRSLMKVIDVMPHRHPPMLPRLLLLGSRGSGIKTQAQKLAVKYHFVHVVFEDVMERAMLEDNVIAQKYRDQRLAGCVSPQVEVALLGRKLLSCECLLHGWVLTGYPRNVKEFELLDTIETPPNRVIFVHVPPKECFLRLHYRQQDTCTGAVYSVLGRTEAPCGEIDLSGIKDPTQSRLTSHPRNSKKRVIKDIEDYFNAAQAMMEYASKSASHVDGAKPEGGVFELIEQILISPAPACKIRQPLDHEEISTYEFMFGEGGKPDQIDKLKCICPRKFSDLSELGDWGPCLDEESAEQPATSSATPEQSSTVETTCTSLDEELSYMGLPAPCVPRNARNQKEPAGLDTQPSKSTGLAGTPSKSTGLAGTPSKSTGLAGTHGKSTGLAGTPSKSIDQDGTHGKRVALAKTPSELEAENSHGGPKLSAWEKCECMKYVREFSGLDEKKLSEYRCTCSQPIVTPATMTQDKIAALLKLL